MNLYLKQKLLKLRPLLTILTILGATCFVMTQAVSAAPTTAKAKIVNVATVTYKDISGSGGGSAAAASAINVQLKESKVNFSNPPAADDGNPTLSCSARFSTYSSGKMVSKLIALTATANGMDTYNLSKTTTNNNTASTTYDYIALNAAGKNFADNSSTLVKNPGSVTLGSAIVLGSDNTTGVNKLTFPGGALEGFAVDDMIVVKMSDSKLHAYLVHSFDVGKKRTHSHEGAAVDPLGWDSLGAVTQAEELGWLKLKALPSTEITLQNGTKVIIEGDTPDFAAVGGITPVVGEPAGEMVLVELDVTSYGATSTAGYVEDALTAVADGDAAATDTKVCTAGDFEPLALQIEKKVRNITQNLPSGATNYDKAVDGKPSDIMEYEITVNSPKSIGSLVTVTDNIPKYTKLVTFPITYGTDPEDPADMANIFAKIMHASVTTYPKADGTGGTAHLGYGGAAGTGAYNDQLSFYLGKGSSFAAGGGGILPFCTNTAKLTASECTTAGGTWITQIKIYYRVKID